MSPLSPEIGCGDGGLVDPRLDPGIGVGGLEDRLLLMPGALAEHAVEAQPDEQCDERENDDNGQLAGPN